MSQHRRPLVERYPGAKSLPWVELAELPTPVQSVPELAAVIGASSLWVKRDDVSGRVYGGNKVRKLEFLLGEAAAYGARDIITFGAAGSNHALATALYGSSAGLEVHSMLMPQPNAPYVGKNLLASTSVGADLRYFDDRRAALAGAARLRDQLRAATGAEPFVIPFGGTSPLSTLGFVNAGLELADQVSAGLLLEPDLVFVPLGSMGTASGLALGMRLAGLKTRVVSVPVLTEDASLEPDLSAVMQAACVRLHEVDDAVGAEQWRSVEIDVERGFLGDGYASKTEPGLEAIRLMSQFAGIDLETTYTGKTFAALLARGRSGGLNGKNVLFWNTYNSRDISGLSEAGIAGSLVPELREYIGAAKA